MLKCTETVGGEVRQVPVLGMAPDAFHRVEVRGIGRQPLDDDPLPGGQPVLDALCPVGAVSVPDERETVRDVPTQCLKEPEDFRGSDVVGVRGPVEAESAPMGSHGEGADRGEPVAAVPLAEDGRLATGRPGPADHRLEHEAALVKEDDAPTGFSGVFLYGATARPATALLHPRPAPGPGAPVSDNSSPLRAESSRRGRGGSEPRRSGR